MAFSPLGKSEYPVDLTEMVDLKAVPYVQGDKNKRLIAKRPQTFAQVTVST
jgi:hypothetical protein